MRQIIVPLNVLGYREEGEWVALALEMDLRGYGESFKEALDDLADLVLMQISFARFKGEPDLIWRPAEAIWFERFAEGRRNFLATVAAGNYEAEPEYNVAGLPIPEAHVIAAMNNFVQGETTGQP